MIHLLGLLAGAFVLATFSMTSMFWLRTFAIMSNICFITYGLMMDLPPIWLLHALLLPMNCRHWITCLKRGTSVNDSNTELPHPKGYQADVS